MEDEATTDQALEQSVSDRIASKFGFPSQSESADAETLPDESNLAELEWEGQKVKVPASMKDAFMKNEDYTRKTQELSMTRREMEVARDLATQKQLDAMFGDSVKGEEQELNVIDAYLAQAGKQDWSQMSTDQVLRTKIELDGIKERREELKRTVLAKRGQFQNEFKTKIDELRGKSREIASKSIQGFSEETEKAMRAFAVSEGLAEAEVDNVLLDPRSFKIIYKAMQFDKVQKGTTQAAAKADQASKALKPGAGDNRMPAETVSKLNFRKAMNGAKTSGDKARVIEARMAGLFQRGNQ